MKIVCCGSKRVAKNVEENAPEIIEGADFETAMSATGFGKFNVLLLLLALPAGWTSVFETSTMSYVFPVAQCDLDLSLEDKGLLNSATYIGMISSGLIWGFFADTLGRKKLLVFGYLLDGLSVLMSGFSQNFGMLLASKFLGGAIINGPFAALTSYLSEFHSSKYRSKVLMIRGLINTAGNIGLAGVAWAVIPHEMEVYLLDGKFRLHSWNVFLLVCSLPCVLSTIIYILLPESPKYLMASNKTEEALKVMKMVYKMNSGNPDSTFPIKSLIAIETSERVEEIEDGKSRTKIQFLKDGFHQVAPLFCAPPYRMNMFLICCIQIGLMLSINTFRLWNPQIFTAIDNYQLSHNGSTATLCEMLSTITGSENNETSVCFVNTPTAYVYINTMMVASTTVVGFILTGLFINKLNKKIMFAFLTLGAASCILGMYFAANSEFVSALSSLFMTQTTISLNIIVAIVVDLVPTTFRTLAIALAMTIGRAAVILGNMMFPILLKIGCLFPFLFVALFLFSCFLLSWFIPKVGKEGNR